MRLGDGEVVATLTHADPDRDLALLRIEGRPSWLDDARALELRDTPPRPGEDCIILGHPASGSAVDAPHRRRRRDRREPDRHGRVSRRPPRPRQRGGGDWTVALDPGTPWLRIAYLGDIPVETENAALRKVRAVLSP